MLKQIVTQRKSGNNDEDVSKEYQDALVRRSQVFNQFSSFDDIERFPWALHCDTIENSLRKRHILTSGGRLSDWTDYAGHEDEGHHLHGSKFLTLKLFYVHAHAHFIINIYSICFHPGSFWGYQYILTTEDAMVHLLKKQ